MKSKIIKVSESFSYQLFSTEEEFIDNLNYRSGKNSSIYAMYAAASSDDYEMISDIIAENGEQIETSHHYNYIRVGTQFIPYTKGAPIKLTDTQIGYYVFLNRYKYIVFLIKKKLLR